jgi:hypothetical protein
MNEQLLMVVVFGSILAGLGLFASYMEYRQKEQERRENQGDRSTH